MAYCTKCGLELHESDSFCSKCGVKTSDALPLKNSKYERFRIAGSKVVIILGVLLMIISIFTFDLLRFLLAMTLFAIGFVDLKLKSKSVQQLTGVIALILAIVSFSLLIS